MKAPDFVSGGGDEQLIEELRRQLRAPCDDVSVAECAEYTIMLERLVIKLHKKLSAWDNMNSLTATAGRLSAQERQTA